jgi:site-specific recombinase XerD
MTLSSASALSHQKLEEIFDACIQTLTNPHRYYRAATHRFLAYLQTDFPQLLHLSELSRDPHLLGWLRRLAEQDPPLSYSTRRIYLVGLRRLLHDLAAAGHSLQPGLILSEDFPPHPRRYQLAQLLFGDIFDACIQTLATTLRPSTTERYRSIARHFLAYLQTDFPQLLHLFELSRDPHLLGWLRRLGEQDPPLSHRSREEYLLRLRSLFHELACAGHPLQPLLILPEDFPPRPQRSQLAQFLFGEIFDAWIGTLATTLRPSTTDRYRRVARHFLNYLHSDFPQLLHLSELRRDPHLLGWLRRLCQQDPPWSYRTRRIYLVTLRRLLIDLASTSHPLQPGLILPEDFLPHPRRVQLPQLLFGEICDACIQTLATTLRPSTIGHYRGVARHFLAYLQADFPQLRHLSELRRDPHLLGWLRRLCQQDPPLSNSTRLQYLLNLRRLLVDLGSAGHLLQSGLILPEDFPPQPRYLPRALSPEEDRQLQQELSRTNDLLSNALLLTRATGIRIGECIHLALDCLRSLGQHQWALQVPLGKLYTERLVPADEHVRQIVTHILTLRALAPASHLAQSATFLLPRPGGPNALYQDLRRALHQVAGRARCSPLVTPHQLRHTYASEMIRLGVSLPALMQLLGHKDVRMTMRYVQVTQQDLQREFQLARQNAMQHHHIPDLPVSSSLSANSDLPGIQRALAALRHLLEMYRRQLQDEKCRRKLQRLDKRLFKVVVELDRFGTPEK